VKEWQSLFSMARDGDLEAYGRIVRQFQDMAYGSAYAILGDFHLAQDAAQEAFIEAHRKLDQLRDPAAFPGWFRRIVFKHCDRITRRKHVPTTPLDTAVGTASDELTPAQAVEKREMQEKVLQAIRSLPNHQRMTTTLFYINGYSQNDIAEFLEVPLTTVKKRLHDSRTRLKERMIDMVEQTLHKNAPDERFSKQVIDELLARPRPLEIEGHPIQQIVETIRLALLEYEWIDGDEKVDRSSDAAVESGRDKVFYVDENTILRTETSVTTFNAIVGRKPPVHLITAGRVFRDDAEDANHQKVFHQLDVICIKAGADREALKATLVKAIESVLLPVEFKWEAAQYPCVEQALDVSVNHGGRWLEIAGCGMLTVETLTKACYDPKAVSGYAFGLGLERIALLKHNLDDICQLWQAPYVPD